MASKRTPTTFSSLLVSDRRDTVSKTLNPVPSASPAAITEIQSDKGALLVSRLTTTVLDALKNEGQAVNGMLAYDVTKKKFVFFQEDKWVVLPDAAVENYVEGPDSSEDGDMVVFGREGVKKKALTLDPVPAHLVKGPAVSVPGNVAVFKDETGSEIADSGLNVQKITRLKGLSASDLLQLTNLGALQFVKGLGVILVDDLIPVTFYMQGTGGDAQVCTVFGGDLPAQSSSESALVEINSSTGALLVSRMNTDQRKALRNPQNGMMVYDTEGEAFFFYQNKTWTPLSAGDVGGPSTSLQGEIPAFKGKSGKEIMGSGVRVDESQAMTGLHRLIVNTPSEEQTLFSVEINRSILAQNYYVPSSRAFKTVLSRGEETEQEAHALFKELSFVTYTHHHDPEETPYFGLIAEEVADIAPHWVKKHKEGIVLNKSALLDMGLVVVQKLMRETATLHKKLSSQQRKLDALIQAINQRAKKNGLPVLVFEDESDE